MIVVVPETFNPLRKVSEKGGRFSLRGGAVAFDTARPTETFIVLGDASPLAPMLVTSVTAAAWRDIRILGVSMDELIASQWCPECRGSGAVWADVLPGPDVVTPVVPGENLKQCPRCGGSGSYW